MPVERMEHVGVVVEDLDAATEFFVSLGFEAGGRATLDDPQVGLIVGLDEVRTEVVHVKAPGDSGSLELIKFLSPAAEGGEAGAPANTVGLRHLAVVVDDIRATVAELGRRGVELVGELVEYGGHRLCYVRGPEGIIVELAEKVS